VGDGRRPRLLRIARRITHLKKASLVGGSTGTAMWAIYRSPRGMDNKVILLPSSPTRAGATSPNSTA